MLGGKRNSFQWSWIGTLVKSWSAYTGVTRQHFSGRLPCAGCGMQSAVTNPSYLFLAIQKEHHACYFLSLSQMWAFQSCSGTRKRQRPKKEAFWTDSRGHVGIIRAEIQSQRTQGQKPIDMILLLGVTPSFWAATVQPGCPAATFGEREEPLNYNYFGGIIPGLGGVQKVGSVSFGPFLCWKKKTQKQTPQKIPRQSLEILFMLSLGGKLPFSVKLGQA